MKAISSIYEINLVNWLTTVSALHRFSYEMIYQLSMNLNLTLSLH